MFIFAEPRLAHFIIAHEYLETLRTFNYSEMGRLYWIL